MVGRGEIWLANLDPTIGSEIRKTRLCVIVSPQEINDNLRTVMAAPMTSGSRAARFRVPLSFNGVDGFILLEQCRALDRRRLVKMLGTVPSETMRQALRTLRSFYED